MFYVVFSVTTIPSDYANLCNRTIWNEMDVTILEEKNNAKICGTLNLGHYELMYNK